MGLYDTTYLFQNGRVNILVENNVYSQTSFFFFFFPQESTEKMYLKYNI